MQIHEITQTSITEGILNTIGQDIKNVVKKPLAVASALGQPGAWTSGSAYAAARDQQQRAEVDANLAQLAKQGIVPRATTAPAVGTRRIAVSLVEPNNVIPTKYYKTGNTWTNELGKMITDPKSIAWLDGKIPTHGKMETIPAQPVAAVPGAKRVSRRRGIK